MILLTPCSLHFCRESEFHRLKVVQEKKAKYPMVLCLKIYGMPKVVSDSGSLHHSLVTNRAFFNYHGMQIAQWPWLRGWWACWHQWWNPNIVCPFLCRISWAGFLCSPWLQDFGGFSRTMPWSRIVRARRRHLQNGWETYLQRLRAPGSRSWKHGCEWAQKLYEEELFWARRREGWTDPYHSGYIVGGCPPPLCAAVQPCFCRWARTCCCRLWSHCCQPSRSAWTTRPHRSSRTWCGNGRTRVLRLRV